MKIGTPYSSKATKVLLCGAGELGKEFVIELQRFGVEVIVVDRYDNAPAMQVAHRSYTLSMLDGKSLKKIILKEKPDYIVPEIEAIATDVLLDIEKSGFKVIPTAKAVQITMNREGIRKLAAEKLKLKTSPYQFASNKDEYLRAVKKIGYPHVIKPVMSSSGKGQSIVKNETEIDPAWDYAQLGGRAGAGKVIIEGFIDFDYEITLLTVAHEGGISFCEPVGHIQVDGDYRESWQPQPMSRRALTEARKTAEKVVSALGGYGVFGVELFIKGSQVYFSEVSPRPHDTGMVTMISQELSEFALHARAILGLPIPEIRFYGPSASCVILGEGEATSITFSGVEKALKKSGVQVRLFGKPDISGKRRLGVVVARGNDIEKARTLARSSARAINVELD